MFYFYEMDSGVMKFICKAMLDVPVMQLWSFVDLACLPNVSPFVYIAAPGLRIYDPHPSKAKNYRCINLDKTMCREFGHGRGAKRWQGKQVCIFKVKSWHTDSYVKSSSCIYYSMLVLMLKSTKYNYPYSTHMPATPHHFHQEQFKKYSSLYWIKCSCVRN